VTEVPRSYRRGYRRGAPDGATSSTIGPLFNGARPADYLSWETFAGRNPWGDQSHRDVPV